MSTSIHPLDEFMACTSTDQMIEYIQHHYPGWIRYVLDGYACDIQYNILSRNWKQICDQSMTTPHKIILVEFIHPDEVKDNNFTHNNFTHDDSIVSLTNFSDIFTYIISVCDVLTQHGCCVRRINEFQPCSGGCNRAIFTRGMAKRYLGHTVWQSLCDSCSSKEYIQIMSGGNE